MKKLGVVLKHTKAALNYSSVRCLGHLITYGGYRVAHPKLVKKVVDFDERMTTKEQVSKFVGLVTYNREYIPGVSNILAPLMDIKSDRGEMEQWDDEIHGAAVRELITAPILRLPDMTKQFKLCVDNATTRAI